MARVSTTGIRKLELKFERRVNFLKEGGIRRLLQEVGRDVVSLYTEKIQTFTPGEVADLSAKYKPTKERRFGRLYPILVASGAMLASLYSRVYRGPPWSIRIGWAGTHPSGLRNAELAAIHANGEGTAPARDFTKLPPGWSKRWLAEVGRRLRREK